VALVLIAFICGLAVGAVWVHRGARGSSRVAGPVATGEESLALSEGTKAILKRLDSPVEIKFYGLLDPSSTPDSVKAFARRVDQLLTAYQQAATGMVNVVRYTSPSYATANAAVADGIKPFSVGTGSDCFLGVAVANKGHKESLAQLSPEWEAALEIDITRAIANVLSAASSATAAMPVNSKVEPAAIEEVKRAIPNLDSVSLEDATRLLREAALKDFTKAANESQAQLKEAQQRLSQAQNGGSEADQQAAVKHLQEVQTAQAERLKDIAAKSQAQIEVLRRLKSTSQ